MKLTRLLPVVLASLALLLSGCKKSETVEAFKDAASWEKQISAPSLTKDEFTRLYAQAAASELKGAEVKIIGPLKLRIKLPAAGEVDAFLDNAWIDSSAHGANRPEIVRRYLHGLTAANASPASGPPDTLTLVPVVRDDEFLKQVENAASTNKLVTEPLAADIHVLYVSDSSNTIAYLTENDRKKLKVELPELRILALANLHRILPDVMRHGEGPLFMITADGNYESSLILADALWEKIAPDIQGDIVAAIPTRDLLLFTSSKSPEGIALMQKAVKETYTKGAHVISTTLLIRKKGKWEKFTP